MSHCPILTETVGLAPFIDRLWSYPKALRKNRPCFIVRLIRRPRLWRRRSILVAMKQHGRTRIRLAEK